MRVQVRQGGTESAFGHVRNRARMRFWARSRLARSPSGGVPGAIAGFALFLFFSYAISWGCACLALVTDGPESAQGLSLLILFPMAFISNAVVPTGHMPLVIRDIANWNPLSAVTAATRQLWSNPNLSATVGAWPMQHPILAALAWSALMLAVFAPLAATLYRRRTVG